MNVSNATYSSHVGENLAKDIQTIDKYRLSDPDDPQSDPKQKFSFPLAKNQEGALPPQDLETLKSLCRQNGVRYIVKESLVVEGETARSKRGIVEVSFSREQDVPATKKMRKSFEDFQQSAIKKMRQTIDKTIEKNKEDLKKEDAIVKVGSDDFFHLGTFPSSMRYVESLGYQAHKGTYIFEGKSIPVVCIRQKKEITVTK